VEVRRAGLHRAGVERHHPTAHRAVGRRARTVRIVLVHGTMDRASSFAKVRRHLDDLDVVTYDRRGYGRARDNKPTSLEDHIEDLEAHLDGPTVIVGHSLGGDLA